MATILTYSNGTDAHETVVPPSDWMPASATDAELAYFSIPARPSEASALKAWDDEWVGHWIGVGTDGFECKPDTTMLSTYIAEVTSLATFVDG